MYSALGIDWTKRITHTPSGRDFIYVDDIVAGLLRCAECGAPGDVYNLASGIDTTIRELAATQLQTPQ